MSESDLNRISRALGTNPRALTGNADGGPVQQFCGDIDMRIARDGTWFYNGSPIGRKPMVKLFASVLKRDDGGDYWLETPFEKCRIQVEDAPFLAVEMKVDGDGKEREISFRTNVDDWVTAGPEHPIRVVIDVESGEPSPYVFVRDGLDALIVRSVFYDLVELGEEQMTPHGEVLNVRSAGMSFALGTTGED